MTTRRIGHDLKDTMSFEEKTSIMLRSSRYRLVTDKKEAKAAGIILHLHVGAYKKSLRTLSELIPREASEVISYIIELKKQRYKTVNCSIGIYQNSKLQIGTTVNRL
jgi:hypothetical protein